MNVLIIVEFEDYCYYCTGRQLLQPGVQLLRVAPTLLETSPRPKVIHQGSGPRVIQAPDPG